MPLRRVKVVGIDPDVDLIDKDSGAEPTPAPEETADSSRPSATVPVHPPQAPPSSLPRRNTAAVASSSTASFLPLFGYGRSRTRSRETTRQVGGLASVLLRVPTSSVFTMGQRSLFAEIHTPGLMRYWKEIMISSLRVQVEGTDKKQHYLNKCGMFLKQQNNCTSL